MKAAGLITCFLQLATASTLPPNPLAMALHHLYKDLILEKRQQIDNYYITLCENANYGGRCARIQAAWGICITLIQENENWASSAKADAGGKCVLFYDPKCSGTFAALSSAGITNLTLSGLDNEVSSFRCGA